ncbi:hypothetical protein CPB86DRAFT_790140 [Serendipita vermifera]|nr:hypothetical protein CPB86DRAFT_790140 [Serendipita vermifera]
MHTRPLPNVIFRLLLASGLVTLLTFIFSLVNLRVYSLYVTPVACFITAIHHTTLFVLSRRKVGPPPLAQAANASPFNQSRSSVYRPASPNGASLKPNDIIPIVREQHVYSNGPTYPSYTVSVVNCTLTFLIALLWIAGSWLPIYFTLTKEQHPTVRNRTIPILEGAFGYCEAIILLCLFGLFAHHRKLQLRTKEFIRMDN